MVQLLMSQEYWLLVCNALLALYKASWPLLVSLLVLAIVQPACQYVTLVGFCGMVIVATVAVRPAVPLKNGVYYVAQVRRLSMLALVGIGMVAWLPAALALVGIPLWLVTIFTALDMPTLNFQRLSFLFNTALQVAIVLLPVLLGIPVLLALSLYVCGWVIWYVVITPALVAGLHTLYMYSRFERWGSL
jgi:hypothetical protein